MTYQHQYLYKGSEITKKKTKRFYNRVHKKESEMVNSSGEIIGGIIEDEYLSLEKLWSENDRKAFFAISKNKSVVSVIGIDNQKAYGWNTVSRGVKLSGAATKNRNIKIFDKDRVHWKFYEEPKAIPHYKAIIKKHYSNIGMRYITSTVFYISVDDALAVHGDDFVRLDANSKEMLKPLDFNC